jgi:hypothetical protein
VADDRVEYFKPTSGRLIGGIGVMAALAIIILVGIDGLNGSDLTVILAAAFLGVLIWAAMLRPRVGLSQETLVLRNMVTEAKIPLASIERLGLRQVLAVRAGDRRFVSPAIGRSLRSMRRASGTAPDPVASYADFVEERIRHRMEDARARAGIAMMSDEQAALAAGVRREWAWLEFAALAVTGVGFVLALIF